MLSSLMENNARKLNQLLRMVTHETKNLQTTTQQKESDIDQRVTVNVPRGDPALTEHFSWGYRHIING